MGGSLTYAIITPVRNEEKTLPATIQCVASQEMRPVRWVIVDDGSSDGTPAVIAGAEAKYNWILGVRLADRGFRKPGAGVIEAFAAGYSQLAWVPADIVVKLDADITFGSDYFARLLKEFENDPHLGIASGRLDTETIKRFTFQNHTQGPSKAYRRTCLDEIGGLRKMKGWDLADDISANMRGWHTREFNDVLMHHDRIEGRAVGVVREEFEIGKSAFRMGYLVRFVFLRAAKMTLYPPYGIRGVGYCAGFLWGLVTLRNERLEPEFRRFLRCQQRDRLRNLTHFLIYRASHRKDRPRTLSEI